MNMVMNTRQAAPKMEFSSVQQPPTTPTAPSATTTPIPKKKVVSDVIITHFQPSIRQAQNGMYQEFVTDQYCVDRESVQRKFGWGMLGTHHVPFIYRNGDKYCSVRMVEKHIYDLFLSKISDNIYFGCTNILGYFITIPESALLNEINEFHCDNFYGALPFKQGDVLVKLDEANLFFEFLMVCSNKLFNTPCDEKKCGFLTLNEKSVVPYIIIKDRKFVPRFYFDGMEGLKFDAQSVKGWNLSYLRFCFKVHGIRDEFSKQDDCVVIPMDELEQYLEPDESFKEWWPTISNSNKGIFQPKKINKPLAKPWHQHPITVLPISIVKYSKDPPNENHTPASVPNPSPYYRTISHK